MARSVEQEIRRRLLKGLEAASTFGAASIGDHLREYSVAEEGRRSKPGEYPYLDTGELSQHVASEVDAADLAAGYGINNGVTGSPGNSGKNPAEYFHELETEMGRLGLVDQFQEDFDQIAAAFELAASQ